MGSASSISSNNQNINNVYISYDNTLQDNHLQIIRSKIETIGFNVITSEVTKLCEKQNVEYISNTIEETMKTCKYLIICVSNKTIRSFLQTIELNIALDYGDKLIYIITEKDLNLITNSIIRTIIKDKKCFRCYDDYTLTTSINKIIDILDT
jgi:hypothetical protein